MKITSKLQWLVGGLITSLVSVCGVALWQSSTTRDANERTYKSETLATAALADANSSLWALRLGTAQYRSIADSDERQKLVQSDSKNYADFDKHVQTFSSLPLSDSSRAAMRDVNENYKKYATARVRWVDKLIGGEIEEAAILRDRDLTPAGRSTVAAIGKLINLLSKEAEAGSEQRNADLQTVATWMLVSCVLVIAGALTFTILMVRSMSKRLNMATKRANELAELHLDAAATDHGNDEVSAMMGALNTMRDKLVDAISEVRQGTDTIATASSQIAAGNMDLSSRTEQQASSLEETAASMEELTSTVKQNADNARQANQLAESASNVAVKGGRVVSQVVDTMSAINSSSKKIVDIIGVIDGIAFQTNILALNAAVEAARAGEQGRGFAVVAAEVRNLAQRSAAAAKEIKTLIGDSVDKVEEGSKQVLEAGKTMDEIVGSVKRVTDIMAEISVASQEQTSGIEQINQAITQMDQVTQQNAALVEEAAAAAQSLQEQASGLSQVVSVFRLEGSQQIDAIPSRRTAASHQQPAHLQPPAANPAIAVTKPKRGSLPMPSRQLAAATPTSAGDWEAF
ncbi:methyl-accepting chemotaxis protein [Polaromonas sp.]|uniref:methyl-accepting chemotaxis protein n=1 Tax=Polaromonas sp. TaxID=1869339 RepID=UPI0017EE4212|nr:methyl-accepting chemotaxis protein [Polaromonas sp.]NMM05784.1 HAMP domain-containing protein [Polaromonas sp.]